MGATPVVRRGGENLPEILGSALGFIVTVVLIGLATTIAFCEQLLMEWRIDARMPEADRIRTFFETAMA